MDRIQELRMFVSIARAGSLSAAAREADVPVSQVWRYLRSLENYVGTPLFSRSPKALKLTDAGRGFLGDARRLVESFDDAIAAARDGKGQPSGHLLLQSSADLVSNILAPALPDFLRLYPQISVHLWALSGSPDIVANDVDIAVRMASQADSAGIMVRKLADVKFTLCASPDYLSGVASINSPGDIAAHQCYPFRYDMAVPAWLFDKDGRKEELAVNGPLSSNATGPLKEAVLAGRGITLVPDWWVRRELADGTLVELLPDWQASLRGFDPNVHACWRAERELQPKIRAMLDFLVERFRAIG